MSLIGRGRFWNWFYKYIFQTNFMNWYLEHFLRKRSYMRATEWVSINDRSTLVHAMAWCRQETNHYLNQYWPRCHHTVLLGHNELLKKVIETLYFFCQSFLLHCRCPLFEIHWVPHIFARTHLFARVTSNKKVINAIPQLHTYPRKKWLHRMTTSILKIPRESCTDSLMVIMAKR